MSKNFKNPNRKNAEHYKPYVPQYQKMKIVPQKIDLGNNSGKSPGHDQLSPMIGKDKYNMINIGNTQEDSWSVVDGVVLDKDGNEVQIDQDLIDNNDEVSIPGADQEPVKHTSNNKDEKLLNNDYILLCRDKVILTGEKEEVISCIKDILYGNHPSYQNDVVDQEELKLFKQIEIKIGIFID